MAAAGIAVLFAFQPDWSAWRPEQPATVNEPAADARSERLAIQGLELVSLDQGRLAMALDAELFWVRPRKFLFYSVGEENELYIEGARLQIYLSPGGAVAAAAGWADAAGRPLSFEALLAASSAESRPETLAEPAVVLPSSAAAVPLLSEMGLKQILKGFPELAGVTQISIRGITIEVFRGMQRVLLLTADNALSDSARRGVRFTKVRVEKPGSGQPLIAPTAVWDAALQRLLLAEGYQQLGLWGSVAGGPASLDVDLEISPYSSD